MPSVIDRLNSLELINPPKFLPKTVQYETQIGSVAYGVSSQNSDIDVIGFCIPPKQIIFPHLAGVVLGFDNEYERFEQFQQHHVEDKDARKQYDFTIYGIVKYFMLCANGNPNMIDSLFTPRRCVLYSTPIGEIVRSNRKLFLSKKCWHTHKGYAYSQLSKMRNKETLGMKILNLRKKYQNTSMPYQVKVLYDKYMIDLEKSKSTRHYRILEYGYDVKFAYHVVRLLNQAEQILTEHDLDITRNREQLKSIRRGEWEIDKIDEYFDKKEAELETVHANSTLRYSSDKKAIKEVLLNCLEAYFGSIDKFVVKNVDVADVIKEIDKVIDKYR